MFFMPDERAQLVPTAWFGYFIVFSMLTRATNRHGCTSDQIGSLQDGVASPKRRARWGVGQCGRSDAAAQYAIVPAVLPLPYPCDLAGI